MFSILSILAVVGLNTIDFSAKDYYELQVYAGAIEANPFAPYLIHEPLENRMDSIEFLIAQHERMKEEQEVVIIVDSNEINYLNELNKFATPSELNSCLVHESPLVRFYAYKVLLENDQPINRELEAEMLSDTTNTKLILQEDLIPSIFEGNFHENNRIPEGITSEETSI